MRCLVAGQWPDLVSPEASSELGSILGHRIVELSPALSALFLLLKHEGVLSVEQTKFGDLKLIVQNSLE